MNGNDIGVVTRAPVRGLLPVLTPDEVTRMEQEVAELKKEEDEKQQDPFTLEIAAYVKRCWEAAKLAKQPIQDRIYKCLRQRRGEYEAERLAQIHKQGSNDTFMMITNIKCRAFESWIKDIMFPAGERPFGIEATPVPDLPFRIKAGIAQRVQQQVIDHAVMTGIPVTQETVKQFLTKMQDKVKEILKKKADSETELIEDEIDDELVEGGWYEALRKVIPDIGTYPAGFLKGPTIRNVRQLEWPEAMEPGPPAVVVRPQRRYFRVSPLDIYPSPGARNLNDGYLCERLRMTVRDLEELIGVEGFSESAIKIIISEYGVGGLRDWLFDDTERATLENRHREHDDPQGFIDCVEFHGTILGSQIIEWAASHTPNAFDISRVDPFKGYEVSLWYVGTYVIGLRFNMHPLGSRYYYTASFEEQNDSIWGKSIPEVIEDIQRVCNASVRALVDNMGAASGPMIWALADRLPEGTLVGKIFPWKIWQFNSPTDSTSQQPPMGFFQPNANVEALLKVYQYFFDQASEVSGIPAYTYGSPDVGGAARTASGLSMLMNAASKGLKMVVGNIDYGIVIPSVKEHWLHIMLFEPMRFQRRQLFTWQSAGDINIRARASEHLIMREQQQIRLNELLQLTANPLDAPIIGKHGRAEMLRQTFMAHHIPGDIVPDDEELMAQEQAELQGVLQRISQVLGIPFEQLVAIAQGNVTQQAPQQAQETDAAGNKPSGADTATMQKRKTK